MRMKSTFLFACGLLAVLAIPAGATTPSPRNPKPMNWSFSGTDPSGNPVTGSGKLTITNTGLVVKMNGKINGKGLTLYACPGNGKPADTIVLNNDPEDGQCTIHGVPNTGGADYIFDSIYNVSTDPTGVDFVILPGSDVGEYWPLVSP